MTLSGGAQGRAAVPNTPAADEHEADELCDGDTRRDLNKDVVEAMCNVKE